MKFEQIIEDRLYQNKDYANVYTKKEGLLYHMGTIYQCDCLTNESFKDEFELKMYFVDYNAEFIRDMEFKEIRMFK